MSEQYHITGLVVQVLPSSATLVSEAIGALVGADIHAITAEGKLVVTLESESQAALLENIETVNALSGVLSSSLVYHQVEPLTSNLEETP